MNNTVKIITKSDETIELIVNPARAAQLNCKFQSNVYLCFGNQMRYVHVQISDEVSYENIVISKTIVDQLHLPEYPIYEIISNKDELIIGPFIGLLMSKEDKRLTAKFFKKMMIYVKKYSELHGAIVVFALNKIDKDKKEIVGYCYNPIENRFEKGTFPFPSSIYRTIGLGNTWKAYFLSSIGDKLFNSQYFSKWKMHEWFSGEPQISPHIPCTILYKSEQNIFDMLEKFKKIYVKPIFGLRGRGIFQISKENGIYFFKHRKRTSNFTNAFETKSEASEFVQTHLNSGKYIIQQAINLMHHEGRIIDFRCIMQKRQLNRWECNAIIAKYGDKNSIVSNISSGGTAFDAAFLFKEVLHLSENQSYFMLERIKLFAFQVCNKLDLLGINCGTLGLDIGIDTDDYIWLIEINNRDPDPTIALDINDVKLYCDLKTNPLFYAKALAGF